MANREEKSIPVFLTGFFPVFFFAIVTFLHIFKQQEVQLEGRCFVSLLFTFELSLKKYFSQRV